MEERGIDEHLASALWSGSLPGASLWAVLDCARDERIVHALHLSRLDYRCLYSGRIPPTLEEVAPHLVELPRSSAFATRLLTEGWGRSWGIFVETTEPENLRYHLRKLLRVQDERGGLLLFRFYDPRVLRVYLPTCRTEELRALFSGIDRFHLESADGQQVLTFEFDGTRLLQRATPVGALAG